MSVIVSIVPVIIGNVKYSSAESDTAKLLSEDGVWLRPEVSLPVSIRNEGLFRQALENMGAGKINAGNEATSLLTEIDNQVIQFIRNKGETYTAHFYGKITASEAESFVSELEEEYGNVVQNQVYETLKRKAESNGMTLVNETVQNDQTIVLTYNLN